MPRIIILIYDPHKPINLNDKILSQYCFPVSYSTFALLENIKFRVQCVKVEFYSLFPHHYSVTREDTTLKLLETVWNEIPVGGNFKLLRVIINHYFLLS
jgi:hypothetical protein